MLILNEKKYAEDIYLGKNKDIKSIVQKIGYVTRYQLHVLGYDKSDNYTYTVKWMMKYHDNFDESCYSKLISDAIKKAYKKPFFNIEDIIITKSELEIITSLENLRAEKILFVLLCLAKHQRSIYGFTNGLVKYSLSDVFKMARVSVPTDEREYILYEIVKKGYLDYPKKNDTSCLMVTFIDEGEIELTVNETDCKELAYTYLNWKNNGGYSRCEDCGKLFRKNRNRKYCYECSKYKPTGDRRDHCVDCGKEIIIDSMASKTYRCEWCQKKADYAPMETKIIVCADCRNEFEVDSLSRSVRCKYCNEKYQKERNRIKNQAYRDRNKNS